MDKLIFWMIAAIFLFSTTDAVLTITEIENGWAYEANPIMAFFYNIHPLAFFIAKTLIMVIALSYLWRNRELAMSRGAIVLGLIIYSAILGWHAHALMFVV